MKIISDFTSVTSGYKTFSDPSHGLFREGWRVLQLRDFTDAGSVQWDRVERLPAERDLGAFEVRENDVLFAARSPRLGALLLDATVMDHHTIASSHFYILRADPAQVAPGYLAWFLNHAETQKTLAAENRGTHLPFIPVHVIRNLPLPLPALELQHRIGELDALAAQERRLINQLDALNTTCRAALTWRAAHTG